MLRNFMATVCTHSLSRLELRSIVTFNNHILPDSEAYIKDLGCLPKDMTLEMFLISPSDSADSSMLSTIPEQDIPQSTSTYYSTVSRTPEQNVPQSTSTYYSTLSRIPEQNVPQSDSADLSMVSSIPEENSLNMSVLKTCIDELEMSHIITHNN